jgi:NADH dehydrogenase (ubiquinone) 1 alpha subcomplex subunit 4
VKGISVQVLPSSISDMIPIGPYRLHTQITVALTIERLYDPFLTHVKHGIKSEGDRGCSVSSLTEFFSIQTIALCCKDAPPASFHWPGQETSKFDPLFMFIGAALYVMHLAMFSPDVSWDRKNNPELWNKVGPKDQYKFYSVNVDYSKLKKEGPDF